MSDLTLSAQKPLSKTQHVNAATVSSAPRSVTALRKQTLDAVNKHDWKAFLSLCDPENRKAQKQLGVNDIQYIIEALNLHTRGNSLEGDVKKRETLGQIASISLKRPVSNGDGTYTLSGEARLTNGKTLNVTFDASKRADGSFQISPALG